jgi:hypothetical protein
MINIKRLKRPSKRSGYPIKSGDVTTVRGMLIRNGNPFTVYIDKYTPKRKAKKK